RFSNEKASIQSFIRDTYPKFDDIYEIEHEALYVDGTWYGAKLDYVGNGIFNRDSVGLVLHKSDNKWQTVVDYPLPSLNQPNYPDVPIALIEQINQLLHAN